ncbi:MAG: hypothetical protein EBS19_15700, partial [Spirochaetia bacterium]|nr:hypothetical protein [Spirochaetia bacterium]
YSPGKSPSFQMPSIYQMQTGLRRDKVYIIRLTLECENMIYALVDYSQLEKIYEALNLNLLATKIDWYSEKIYERIPFSSSNDPVYSSPGDPMYWQKVLMRKNWNIKVVAESQGGNFPYHVYFGGYNDPLKDKLKDLANNCKVCGDDPEIAKLTPGSNEIKCSLGEDQFVIFDKDMSMGLSDLVYDADSQVPMFDDENGRGERGYYVRFDLLGGFLAVWHAGYGEFDNRYLGGSTIVNNKNIIDLLPHKPILFRTKESISKEESFGDFKNEVFTYLIDNDIPTPLLKEISSILGEYDPPKVKYFKSKCYNYTKRLLSWKTNELSAYADLKYGTFFIALPGDENLAKAIIDKLPKNYQEVYKGLDTLGESV